MVSVNQHENNSGSNTVNKHELVLRVAARSGVSTKDTALVVQGVIDEMKAAVAGGESILLSKFGTLESVYRKARLGRNPQSGKVVPVEAATKPNFRPAKAFIKQVSSAAEARKAPTGD